MDNFLWVVFRLPQETIAAKYAERKLTLALATFLCCVHIACSCDRPGTPVTGKDEQTTAAEQSETALSVQGIGDQRVITVSYNDTSGNNGKIVYTQTQRTVYAGASMMGWSYSTNGGNSWTYGGKVTPSQDWPVLWGDPALTASRTRANVAFLSNLAVPKNKYPGPQGIVANLNSNGFVTAVGGACIARSTDSGKTFALYQCVNRPSFDFYDGGSMAAGPYGDIYAAFLDYNTSQIDIWRSPNENGTFSQMPNPFPGIFAVNHPRLRVALDGTLYAATRSSSGDVVVNRFVNGNWGLPKAACHNVQYYPLVTLSDRSLRTGPQFSFDVGSSSLIGNDEVRFVCTTRDPQTQRLFLETSFCRADLSTGCLDAPGWSTSTQNSSGYRADQFNPLVEAFPGFFFGIAPIWKVSFLSRENDPGGNKVSMQQGNLAVLDDPNPANRKRIFLEFDFVTQQVVCPDNRGYWGDYDDLRMFEIKDGYAHFIRAETDSSAGCTKRWDTNSEQVHVSSSTTY